MWQLANDRPIFQQIIDKITADIACGKYQPGQRLEAVRTFALEAGVNPNTMQHALSELERSGLVFSRRGEGRYVTEDTEQIKALTDSIINQKTEEYISSLMTLGFRHDEIIAHIKKKMEEEENGSHS